VLELCRMLDQSQPRVSRHLKLLAEAGLVERFPDGAWVFYRLTGTRQGELVGRRWPASTAADPVRPRPRAAGRWCGPSAPTRPQAYFARNAARWDEIRSLYVAEAEVEAAILKAAGPGPFNGWSTWGSGTGRMLTLLGPSAPSTRSASTCRSRCSTSPATRWPRPAWRAASCATATSSTPACPTASADLVVVHQVLHYLADPAAAVRRGRADRGRRAAS
jgi:hypothetical protein